MIAKDKTHPTELTVIRDLDKDLNTDN